MSIRKSNIVLAVILSLSFAGIYTYTAPTANGSTTKTMKISQQKHQNKPKLVKQVRKQSKSKNKKSKNDWFHDDLSKKELKARHKIAYLESRYQWKATNGKCWGRFQLLPKYLGYKNGHINLNKKNQVKIADKYVHDRYGTWQSALKFHLVHNWY